ncbi:MAG: DUF1822 family protein [Symploca sp. SIO2E6]|nr:DUF1822 family protein [Symploca sp. SIO2E6]
MNSQKIPLLEVTLGREAHFFAREFATEQVTPEKSKQVYLNTLAVYAVHRYLQWLQIKTDLTQSDSWHPVVRSRWNVADLVLPGIGKLECRPVLPGETALSLPIEVTEDRIGYLPVQFSERLEQVQLLGFVKKAVAGFIEISRLQTLEDFINELSAIVKKTSPVVERGIEWERLRTWFEGFFSKDWQSLESVLAYGRRDYTEPENSISRAKSLNLAGRELLLIMELRQSTNEKIEIRLRVRPQGNRKILPPGLQLIVLDESSVKMETQARSTDNSIKLKGFRLPPEVRFTVRVAYQGDNITENFIS